MTNMEQRGDELLRSALALEGQFIKTSDVAPWVRARTLEANFSTTKIPIDALNKWYFDAERDCLAHQSGKFFSIKGIQLNVEGGVSAAQPIIDQPEIGILGFLAKKFGGILHFLIQVKVEPGNVNGGQLSPTVQATKSNYTQVHQGALPRYLEYFLDRTRSRVILDQLQSEQGSFFYKKRNRNLIIEVKEDIEVHDDFCWLTLGQIKQLLHQDNLVNMDARSVLSAISYGIPDIGAFRRDLFTGSLSAFGEDLLDSLSASGKSAHRLAEIISWLTEQKTQCDSKPTLTGLSALSDWERTGGAIHPVQGRYFSVIGVSVQSRSREVASWTQPLIKPTERGVNGFFVKKINGLTHFLVQARMEIGNFDSIELAPSVQYLPGNPLNALRPEESDMLELLLHGGPEKTRFRATQSEEGGRFYHYQNENIVVQLDPDELPTFPANYLWMTLDQMLLLIQFNNMFNMEARGLLACLGFVEGEV